VTEPVRADQAKGRWVQVTIGNETPAYARCTAVLDIKGPTVELSLAEHPVCGHVKLILGRGVKLPAKPLRATPNPTTIDLF
jgi:hypothetical protein